MRLQQLRSVAASLCPGWHALPARGGAWATLLLAAIVDPAFGQYRFDHFTTHTGLPQNTVAAIAQTPDGYLWFATYDGLVRYDGVRFTIFNKGSTPAIPCNCFLTLWVDPHGTLWAGTLEGGLLRYRNGVFQAFTNGLPEKGVPSIRDTELGVPLLCYGKDRGYLWNDNQCSAAPAEPRLLREFADEFGTRWILVPDTLLRYEDGKRTSFPLRLTVEDFVQRRCSDRSGGLWLGTSANGVYHICGGELRHYTRAHGLPADTPIRIAGEDRQGNVWLYSEHELFQHKDGRLTRVESRIGPALQYIRTVFCDREGTVWIGSNDRGLFRLTPRFLTTYAEEHGLLDRTVYPIIEDRAGTIWIGSGSGLTQFTNGRFLSRPLVRPAPETVVFASTDDPRPRLEVRCLCEDRAGRLWLGNPDGLFLMEGDTVADRSSLVDHVGVRVCMEDRGGDLWLGTDKGLFQTRAGEVRARYTLDHGLPELRVTVLHEDRQGQVWVGTRAGLACKRGERFAAVDGADGLSNGRIRCLHEDDRGVLWIGTYDSGLWRLQDRRLTQYTTRAGLHSNGVFQILNDRRGHFWISCNRGVYRVRSQQLDDYADGKTAMLSCVPYGCEEGMLSTECNGERPPAGVRARDGKLWLPTMHGVVVIDPEAVPCNTLPPLVTIESALVDRAPIDIRNDVRLRPGQASLELTYTAPSFLKAEHLQFKYRLVGLHAEWIDAGPQRSVHFSHLPPGRYTFEVRAGNSDGVWSDASAALSVEVLPYFYQTRWFAVLIVVGLLGLTTAVGGAWARRLKANARRLTRLVTERTAELAERSRQLEDANHQLEQLATLDGLTNIANHRRFKEYLFQTWERSQRTGSPLTLLLLDVDYFKRFNDRHGHQGGDDCLQRVATVLREAAGRATDLPARYGGEEFAVVLADTDREGARVVAEAIRALIEALGIRHGDSPVSPHVTVSVGLATTVAQRGTNPEDLIAAADQALYHAKEQGRNRCVAAP